MTTKNIHNDDVDRRRTPTKSHLAIKLIVDSKSSLKW